MLYPQQNLFRNTFDLSGIWDFRIDPDQTGEENGWQNGFMNSRPIAVPGSWNEQYEDIYNYFGLAWYSKSTYIPRSWQGQRVFLRVGSACYFSTVYLNGVKIGSHEGGHLPFAFEITDQIRWESENLIVISVENELKPARVPSGNMDTPLLPVSSYPKTTYDFFPFAGIHRPVTVYSVPETSIEDITVVTGINGNDGTLNVKVRLNAKMALHGSLELKDRDNVIVGDLKIQEGRGEVFLTVPNARFWSDKDPFLYELTVKTEHDQYQLKVGIRSVNVKGGQILLNGVPVQLNGFGRHEDFIASGKGLNLPLMVKDYHLMRWTGANSYRTSHYPYSDEEMQLADREGFLIINEIPAVSLQFEDDENRAERLRMCTQQIDELIARDKNHPCVVMWSVANEPMAPKQDNALAEFHADSAELKGKEFLDALMRRVRELDPTRLVTFAALMGSPGFWLEQADVICLNRYWGWYILGGELDKAVVALEQ